MKIPKILPALGAFGAIAAGAIFATALQAGTVTLRISGVHSAQGNVGVSLCAAAVWADNLPHTLEFLRTQMQVTP